jgi:MYXO-CTERM domain-containing protein
MQTARCMIWAALPLFALATSRTVRADQVVLADVSWSHPTDTASDSHYRVTPATGTPSNWKSPVDYTQGSVYASLDVKTKPAGDAPTKLQICFEGTPNYACTDQSPTYTKVGNVTWTSQFANFYNLSMVDWTMPIKDMALIVKDDMNNKPAGDPKYVPTDLHIVIVLLSKGATYVPANSSAGAGGTAAGAGGARAGSGGMSGHAGRRGMAGAGGSAGTSAADGGHGAAVDAGAAAGTHASDAGVDSGSVVPKLDASTGAAGSGVSGSASQSTNGSSGTTGTTSAGSAAHTATGGSSAPVVKPLAGSNCSAAAGSGMPDAWLAGLVAALLLTRRRRRRG